MSLFPSGTARNRWRTQKHNQSALPDGLFTELGQWLRKNYKKWRMRSLELEKTRKLLGLKEQDGEQLMAPGKIPLATERFNNGKQVNLVE